MGGVQGVGDGPGLVAQGRQADDDGTPSSGSSAISRSAATLLAIFRISFVWRSLILRIRTPATRLGDHEIGVSFRARIEKAP